NAGRYNDTRFKFYGSWQVSSGSQQPSRSAPPTPGGRRPAPPVPVTAGWTESYDLYLKRWVEETGEWIYIDRQPIERNWNPVRGSAHQGRCPRGCHVAYQQVRNFDGDLGEKNDIDASSFGNGRFGFLLPSATDDPNSIPREFVTVGDISGILSIGHGRVPGGTIGQRLWLGNESRVKLDYQNPYNKNIFQYLTVFDPTEDKIDNDGDGGEDDLTYDDGDRSEWKIPGRININTAPWYVIAQLPWMSEEKAQAIVAYRDKLGKPLDYYSSRYNEIRSEIDGRFDEFDIREKPGFASIGELNFVIGDSNTVDYRIDEYGRDNEDIWGFPDLTPGGSSGDGFVDDFEERDVIFSRISNLVTVRSDVFTAYILVRIGVDGPQKRVVAILDRSDVYPYGGGAAGKVKIVALHPVADPR
ncbi:MAG: ComEA family DNA-binding protein, partial [Planctomycetota bacterium]